MAYIAAELKRLACTPLGSETDYRQPFGRGFQNVLGLLPGSDPELQKELDRPGAHCDHVGSVAPTTAAARSPDSQRSRRQRQRSRLPARDIAEQLAAKDHPRRSIMIAFWDAEEKGCSARGTGYRLFETGRRSGSTSISIWSDGCGMTRSRRSAFDPAGPAYAPDPQQPASAEGPLRLVPTG